MRPRCGHGHGTGAGRAERPHDDHRSWRHVVPLGHAANDGSETRTRSDASGRNMGPKLGTACSGWGAFSGSMRSGLDCPLFVEGWKTTCGLNKRAPQASSRPAAIPLGVKFLRKGRGNHRYPQASRGEPGTLVELAPGPTGARLCFARGQRGDETRETRKRVWKPAELATLNQISCRGAPRLEWAWVLAASRASPLNLQRHDAAERPERPILR